MNCTQSMLTPSPSQVTTRSVVPCGVYSSGEVSVSHWLLMSRRKGPCWLFTVISNLAMTRPVALFSRMQNEVLSEALALTTT